MDPQPVYSWGHTHFPRALASPAQELASKRSGRLQVLGPHPCYCSSKPGPARRSMMDPYIKWFKRSMKDPYIKWFTLGKSKHKYGEP